MFNSSTLPLHTLLPSQSESAAQQLLQESMVDPWGSVSPAIYDTARVVFLPRSLQPEGSLDFFLQRSREKARPMTAPDESQGKKRGWIPL